MHKKERELLYYKDLESREKRLIDYIRAIGYGEINVVIQNGLPTRISEYKRSIKL